MTRQKIENIAKKKEDKKDDKNKDNKDGDKDKDQKQKKNPNDQKNNPQKPKPKKGNMTPQQIKQLLESLNNKETRLVVLQRIELINSTIKRIRNPDILFGKNH